MKVVLALVVSLASVSSVFAVKAAKTKAAKTSPRLKSKSVAVIGAGISGLTAAYNLKKLGYDVVVFEAEDRVGGKIESVYLENGAPTSNILHLDDEMEAKAQALCGDERPTDLGAIIATAVNLKDLADEMNVPYGDVILDFKIIVRLDETLKLSRADYLGLLASQINPTDPRVAINAAIEAFFKVVALFPEITTYRLDDGTDANKEELALPLSEFAQNYGITLLVESLRPVIVGYGHGYFEKVPAGIYLQYIYPIVTVLAGLAENVLIGFPCGFQSIPNAMASTMDVRLNAKVTKVKRNDHSVYVKAKGEPPIEFDHLVISTSLDVVPSFLDASDSETDLFSRLSFQRYITTITNTVGVTGNLEVQFYADQGFERNINRINVLAKGNIASSAEISYQIIDDKIRPQEAFEILQENMKTYWNGTTDAVIVQKEVDNFSPKVSPEDFPTFYNDMEDLQGHLSTYYVGSYLSFETTAFSEGYARDLVTRMFEPMESD